MVLHVWDRISECLLQTVGLLFSLPDRALFAHDFIKPE